MFARSLVAFALFAAAFAGPLERRWVVHEARSEAPEPFAHRGAAPADKVLQFRVNLAMGDRDGLERALNAAADPKSATFRQWLSKEQVWLSGTSCTHIDNFAGSGVQQARPGDDRRCLLVACIARH